MYSVKRLVEAERLGAEQEPSEHIAVETISEVMKEYFQLLEEFFIEVTGTAPDKFAVGETFGDRVRRDAKKIATQRTYEAYLTYTEKFARFQGRNSGLLLGAARVIGGLRCVVGGTSRFPKAAFDGLRKFALYADTIFIPDPVLPWIEAERSEERFRHVLLLEACHDLLRLKPLVDADLPYPVVVVFPSWEWSLEASDEETQDGMSELVLGFFSHYLGATFEDESEIIQWVAGSGKNTFREVVDRHRLFWPPGAESPLPFGKAVEQYKKELGTWRSSEWLDLAEALSPEELVLNGILERVALQFHVRDNAHTFDSQPLFWLPAHFHYFRLCSQAGNGELEQTGLLKSQSVSLLQSLLHPNVAWLGNVPIDHLVRLREENRNEEFRRHLALYLEALSTTELDDLDRVSAEVMRGIASLLAEHAREATRIAEEYDKKHAVTIGLSVLTLGVMIYPWLAPLLGAAPALAPAGKYAMDIYKEYNARKTLAHSLAGVLSEAKAQTG